MLTLILLAPVQVQMCKWVDEHGTVHYAKACPEGADAVPVEIRPAPPISPPAPTSSEEPGHSPTAPAVPSRLAAPRKSVSVAELGPLPENTLSRYLETVASGVMGSADNRTARFTLNVRGKRGLQPGAWLEAQFPDPSRPGMANVVAKELQVEYGELTFESPPSTRLRCGNYETEVLIYDSPARDRVLGRHSQAIQSRVDLTATRNRMDFAEAMLGGQCPKLAEGKSAAELRGLCEQAREARLAPLRARAIAKCIEVEHKTPDYCARYYHDYGDASRVRNRMMPRMFDNLPECLAARAAEGD